ncbi:BatA domain-containing protein [Maribacter sp. CXY002]|uniref:BatA domain-containing protein n=1 Tax=Maribacter luteocoastalis TaxID=3407671 RepID=UPI003B67FA4F
MQFKHPEILWALLLLLIPIIIHLFQLRRFKKTPFTNVKLLKKVLSESRRSSAIKKWLVLLSRLGIFASIIIAFAQPYSANLNALKNRETVFYLDNSFSMEAKTENGTLLQNTVQEFIKGVPKNETFTLFTNNSVYKDISIKDIQNDLITLEHSVNQLTLQQITLKANTLFTRDNQSIKNTVVISDFQRYIGDTPTDPTSDITDFIKVSVPDISNIAIDSVYLNTNSGENLDLVALLSSNKNLETIAVSLYDEEKLIAKTAANFNNGKKANVLFTLPHNEAVHGRIAISDKGLAYDNQFYFNIGRTEKIKVLSVGSVDNTFLRKIYGSDEFTYTNVSLPQLNYGALENYNIIILNELESVPTGLVAALQSFHSNGGSLVVIPGANIENGSYNYLLTSYFSTKYTDKINQEIAIANINFEHPLFSNVFEKSVSNFQFPEVNYFYRTSSLAPAAISFQNNEPFLLGNDDIFIFTASLSTENSNFKNSPLIVPTFYNMAIGSLKQSEIYHTIGNKVSIDIPITLPKDNILKLSNNEVEFIPEQRSMSKKVQLTFTEIPTLDGIYTIKNNSTSLKDISFNYNRSESDLTYLTIGDSNTGRPFETVNDYFDETLKANSIKEFWKWFAILALTFVIIETLLQRLLK